MVHFTGPIHYARTDLTESIPLYVFLVKGADYAIWIDSGIKKMFPQLEQTMRVAEVKDSDLRFILHTHSHHDHIGCNAQLKDKTGCLIAAHPHYADWHADFEQHYQEFARPFPHLIPDTPALREEVLSVLDAPRALDIFIEEGVQFNLGGGVSLNAISLPGHMLAEFGWFESSTRTLILGDAITGLDWPLFHSHLSVQAYRDTLTKLRRLVPELDVRQVVFAHFPPMNTDELKALLDRADSYINSIEVMLIRLLIDQDSLTLAELWQGTCERMNRLHEFRSLNMVYAHLQDLVERGLVRQLDEAQFTLR